MDLHTIGMAAVKAASQLSITTTTQKNQALTFIADALDANHGIILGANKKDIALSQEAGLSEALLDRLLLTPERLTNMANDVRNVVHLNDPIGCEIDSRVLENGLTLSRRRVPLGVIGVVYEARPNVTIDVAALCLKTGNATVLRGGKETFFTNVALVEVIQSALKKAQLPVSAVQYVECPGREVVEQLLKLDQYIDVIIPRGGVSLHQLCKENSTIPVIIGGFGISHIFVDQSADLEKSLVVVENAKTQRPSACNALDTLLIDQSIAPQFLPMVFNQLVGKVTFVIEGNTKQLLQQNAEIKPQLMSLYRNEKIRDAVEGDFDTEWLSNTLSVKIVADVDEAIIHMKEHNASHSDAIMTNNLEHAERFINAAGSAVVYINASTRFTDGAQFGLGAEVAVSTQKLHARGPMGLEELTSYKWIGRADYLSRT